MTVHLSVTLLRPTLLVIIHLKENVTLFSPVITNKVLSVLLQVLFEKKITRCSDSFPLFVMLQPLNVML